MKKIFLIFCLIATTGLISACTKCESEPIVQQNHKLIVPPNFGAQPK